MSRHQETLTWSAPRAWCWKCQEFVGLPRLTHAEAVRDVRAHRKSEHVPHQPRPDDVCVKCGRSRDVSRNGGLTCSDGIEELGRHLFTRPSSQNVRQS